jgi:hypothetical protein
MPKLYYKSSGSLTISAIQMWFQSQIMSALKKDTGLIEVYGMLFSSKLFEFGLLVSGC